MISLIADPERDVMVKTVVTEEPLTVDYDDIEARVEPDDWNGEAPWEHCDGWEHEFHRDGYYVHEGMHDSRGWVNRSTREGGSGYIEIDDATVIRWGCTGYPGCSKQVRAEAIATAKRNALDQLVKWYCDGWYVWVAVAEYGDYMECVGGIYDDCYGDYAREEAESMRREVAARMEDDGFTVTGQPDPPKPYNRVDAFRDRIRRNLTM